jgi:hypothetical protein
MQIDCLGREMSSSPRSLASSEIESVVEEGIRTTRIRVDPRFGTIRVSTVRFVMSSSDSVDFLLEEVSAFNRSVAICHVF